MMRQQAARFGAKSAQDAASLEANYKKAIDEGDIFKSIAIKENFLGGLPAHARVIRQSGDEAIKQGVSFEQYNQSFTTGTPVVFPVVKNSTQSTWSSHFLADMETGWNPIKVRALYRTNNPFVVDANGLSIGSQELKFTDLITKASTNGHDTLIILNTLEANARSVSENSPLHNRIFTIFESSKDNIAIIDENTSRESVPRGNGLFIGDSGSALPFRQEEAKRTFYSAVEKFVEEKVTDKTSLNELMGLLDPTKGTGIVKAELEFLDIAGWVEEQKKVKGGTKAKVNKQELLRYIQEHKFELQEDKTNTAWYTQQGLDPNNPNVQSQVEGGYEGYTPARKGYDELHPTTNYRVLLLRGPQGANYDPKSKGGHFPEHQNIIAFARVGDVFLDRVTEMPSPPTAPIASTLMFRLLPDSTVMRRTGSDIHKQRQEISRATSAISAEFSKTPSEVSNMTPLEMAAETMKGGGLYPDKMSMPNHIVLRNVGFILHTLANANLDSAVKINEGVKDIIESNFIRPSHPNGVRIFEEYKASYQLEKQALASGNSTLDASKINYASLVDNMFQYDPVNDHATGFVTQDYDMSRNAVLKLFELVESLAEPRKPEHDNLASKKKMLMVFETQSDTAQNMQGLNDEARGSWMAKNRIKELQNQVRELKDQTSPLYAEIDNKIAETKQTNPLLAVEMEDNRIKFFPDLYAEIGKLDSEITKLETESRELSNKYPRYSGALEPVEASAVSKSPEFIKKQEQIKEAKRMITSWNKYFDKHTKLTTSHYSPDYAKKLIKIPAKTLLHTGLENTWKKAGVDDVMAEKFVELSIETQTKRAVNFILDELLKKNPPDERMSYTQVDFARFTESEFEDAVSRGLILARDENRLDVEALSKDPIGTNQKNFGDKRIAELEALKAQALLDLSKGPDDTETNRANVAGVFDDRIAEQKKLTEDNLRWRKATIATEDYVQGDLLEIDGALHNRFRSIVMTSLYENYTSFKDKIDWVESRLDIDTYAASQQKSILYDMPFLRTEDFSKLMFKKLLREAVTNGYEGIILIPPELPEILTGGKSGYYYGTIFPKVINNYTKKFGSKLRPNKSIGMASSEQHLVDTIDHALRMIGRKEGHVNMLRTMQWFENAVRMLDGLRNSETLAETRNHIVDRISTDAGISAQDADSVLQYFIDERRGTLPASRKGFQLSDSGGKFLDTLPTNIDKQASRKGLILDITPQMDVIKEGQPMWQAAARRPRKPKVEGKPETVGDIRGLGDGTPIAKKQDRSIGERPEGSAIPEIPKQTSGLEVGGVGGIATSIDKTLATQGVADYRGYKIIYDKANGGYRITNPSGKMVPIPIQYKDKFTGETVIKNERTVVFPSEATFLIDHLLGGMPKSPDTPSAPALPKPAQVKQQVVEPAQRAIQKTGDSAPVGDEAGIVQSQIDKTGKSKYYLYNIEFDPTNKQYIAKDNSGQVVPTIVNNPFQSGPATLQANGNPDLGSLLSQLDKKFDKAKWARLAPKAPTASAPVAPVVQQPVAPAPVAPTPVAPVAPVTAVEPPTPKVTPKKRVPASSVPKAVAQATPAPTPKPKSTPKPKQNVNTPRPKVVMPAEVKPTADAEIKPTESPQPVEVVSDKEHMERQAKALGKGFIEMMKDPELSQFIIDSLNVDDNLTLKGDNNSASTADGRFSVDRKGKKYVVMQNNYQSPITGLNYDRRTIAYVNTLQQAQILIRRLEVERNMQLKMKGMPMENPLMVMAAENPAFEQLARDKAIRDNALVMMLLSMRDQGVIPIYIDPNTLQPILVMMPSDEAISQVTRPPRNRQPQIAGLLPESGGQDKLLPAVIDDAIKFDYIQDAQIRQMSKYTKDVAERYRNRLGYEILKFQGKFRLFNPLKASVSVRDDEDAIMNDLIRDIAKKGLQR
jgi:hypothetical protein